MNLELFSDGRSNERLTANKPCTDNSPKPPCTEWYFQTNSEMSKGILPKLGTMKEQYLLMSTVG